MASMFKAECLSDSSDDNDGDCEPGKRQRSTTESSDTDSVSPKKGLRFQSPSGPSKFSHFMPSEGSEEEVKNEDDSETDDQNLGNYSTVSLNLMKKMGYKAGTGLGKDRQGITGIVETTRQRGRRGLGLVLDGLEPSPDVEWDFDKEKIDVKEEVDWMPQCTEDPPDIKELRQWYTEGPKKMTIEDETVFCDPSILSDILKSKSVFDRLEPEEMRRARTRSNPFETIRGGIFQNRAAMKMANIDAIFGFMFTDPRDENGESSVGPDGLLYFADVCAGPGGFSEYVLWKKGWQAKGFGFTLKGPNDFKLEEFFAGPPDTFEPYYGVKGDGDIFVPDNIRSFSRFVKASTDNRGVHFVMADGESSVGPDGLLYFADVCAGPGGFSEYVLWKKGWQAKGFGFTLKGPNDFKLEEFFAGPPDTFEPYYGVKGDGDIFVPDNIRSFSRFVKASTDNRGVHFVMADGGFSVEGQENLQEILHKRLYLCQFCTALSILRTGGHFVCKLFDIFTAYSVGLVYLMYRTFKHVCIFKPNTSRPANSERYIVCKWRREGTKDIQDYLYELCCRFEQISGVTNEQDITDVVPFELLNDDAKFFNYMRDSNNKLGELQVVHLSKIKAFAQNVDLYEARQSSLRKECLTLWKVPDQVRSEPKRGNPEAKFKELTRNDSSYFDRKPDELTEAELRKIKSIYDYRCVVCGEWKPSLPDNKFFYLGLGRKNVYQWSGRPEERWKKMTETLELPADTLLYGEIVQELEGEGRNQRRLNTIHVIDALILGKVKVMDMHYDDRIRWIEKFVKAISKPSRHDLVPLRTKEVFRLEDVGSMFERLCSKMEKGASRNMRLSFCLPHDNLEREEKHFYPSGMLLLRTTKSPWYEEVSRSSGKRYYYNMAANKSSYERPSSAVAGFKSCFTTSLVWPWQHGVRLLSDTADHTDDGKVHRHTIMTFVNEKAIT